MTAYFQNLNYTLANEDTSLELRLLPKGVGHVLAVAGSGGRVVPLLAKHPGRLTCVDVSREQLYLAELRVESVRSLAHAEFLAFWGYPPAAADPQERKKLFDSLSDSLTSAAREFFEGYFESRHWHSLLYDGRWERTFAALSRVNRRITGTKGTQLFSALTQEEHERFLEEEFPWRRWAVVLRLLGNATVFNALLYKGQFPKKNVPESFFALYRRSFDRLFRQGPARRNFFLQLAFFGKVVFAEGCPVECDPTVFSEAQKALTTTSVAYRHGDLVEAVAGSGEPAGFLSLSDVPSYFSGALEREYLQRMKPGIAPDGLVVVRNYLHIPEGLDTAGFVSLTESCREAILDEKVGVYCIEVYRRN
jgi:S-adenosylmethionine-diacylglycerol 3-amino-3-carboxypropyl transferase